MPGLPSTRKNIRRSLMSFPPAMRRSRQSTTRSSTAYRTCCPREKRPSSSFPRCESWTRQSRNSALTCGVRFWIMRRFMPMTTSVSPSATARKSEHKSTRKSILRLVVSFQDAFLCRQRGFRLFRLFRRIIRLYQSWHDRFCP